MGNVVDLAFDLGIVSLFHAQGLEGAERQHAFEKSEQAFLSIRGQMGDAVEYQLYLGQVYMWMGRKEEGQALFDKALGEERSFEVLMALAGIMREIGDDQQSRLYAEEIYNPATEDEWKYAAAQQRSLATNDLSERLEWMEKDKRMNPSLVAGRAYARGAQALEEGEFESAETYLREAVKGYADVAESAESANNGALAAQALYTVSGDLEDYKAGVALQRRAYALQNDNSIIAAYACDALAGLSSLVVLNEYTDFAYLKMTPNTGVMGFCYTNLAERNALYARLHQNKARKAYVEITQRMTVLVPRGSQAWSDLATHYGQQRDAESLANLLGQIRQADLDLSDITIGWEEFYQRNDERTPLDRALAEEEARETIDGFTAQSGITYEIAQVGLLAAQLNRFYQDDVGNVSTFIQEAESLFERHPSASIGNLVQSAYFIGLVGELTQADLIPQSIKPYRWLFDAETYLELSSDFSPKVSEFIHAHPLYQRLKTFNHKRTQAFPESVFDQWLIARLAQGDTTYAAQQLQQDAVWQTLGEINIILQPTAIDSFMFQYHQARLQGDEQAAEACL